MKKQVLSFLLLLSFSIAAAAQKAVPAKVDALESNLRRHVEYLASDKLAGRRTGTPGATAAAGYVANMFAKLKLKPGVKSTSGKAGYLQQFPFFETTDPHGGGPRTEVIGYNVVGILEGTDSVLRNEAIVIGAHYDHLGEGGQGSLAPNSKDIHHGADDNASGTAAIIEIARVFAAEKKNKRTLVFIAFSGEEGGLFGSKFYVANPSLPIADTVAMINLDMVGRMNEKKLTIGGIGTASEWKQLVESKNINPAAVIPSVGSNGHGTNMKTDPPALNLFNLALNEDGFGPSDHSSFYMSKVPVLFFFTGTHLDYHKPTDTAEKINYQDQAGIVNYVASLVRSVDQAVQRPTYAVAKSSGMTGGRTGFNISLGTIPSYTESTDGMIIDGVREASPAARAGLKGGDKIVMLAGKAVMNVQDYTKLLGEMKADVEYDIVVVRGSQKLNLKITPMKRQ